MKPAPSISDGKRPIGASCPFAENDMIDRDNNQIRGLRMQKIFAVLMLVLLVPSSVYASRAIGNTGKIDLVCVPESGDSVRYSIDLDQNTISVTGTDRPRPISVDEKYIVHETRIGDTLMLRLQIDVSTLKLVLYNPLILGGRSLQMQCRGIEPQSESRIPTDTLMKTIVDSLGTQRTSKEVELAIREIRNRVEQEEPDALFNWGWFNFELCKGFIRSQKQDVSQSALCTQALKHLKAVAENPKLRILFIAQRAMYILGDMHKEGIGTQPSRLLAAEWYLKAAKAHVDYWDRESALRALEAALNAVPDHPAALELRTQLLR